MPINCQTPERKRITEARQSWFVNSENRIMTPDYRFYSSSKKDVRHMQTDPNLLCH